MTKLFDLRGHVALVTGGNGESAWERRKVSPGVVFGAVSGFDFHMCRSER